MGRVANRVRGRWDERCHVGYVSRGNGAGGCRSGDRGELLGVGHVADHAATRESLSDGTVHTEVPSDGPLVRGFGCNHRRSERVGCGEPGRNPGLADVFAVFCTTDPEAGQEGFAIVYVPADSTGVTQGKAYRKAGMSGDWNSDVWFDNVRVPAEFRAHGPGEDADAARAFISSGNVGTAAQCIGVMRDTYQHVRDWCDTRVVAGKALKEHTITAAVLADIVIAIETSRAETYLKARMLDRPDLYGPRHSPEMLARTRVTKLFVSDQLTNVMNKAMDLMGAFGYTREGDVEKHWRDSKIMSLWMGGRALPQLDIARWYFDARTY